MDFCDNICILSHTLKFVFLFKNIKFKYFHQYFQFYQKSVIDKDLLSALILQLTAIVSRNIDDLISLSSLAWLKRINPDVCVSLPRLRRARETDRQLTRNIT